MLWRWRRRAAHDIPGKQRIPDIRINDARAINAEIVASDARTARRCWKV